MTLTPIGPSQFDRVACWLSAPENGRWLDFGDGEQAPSAAALAFMAARPQHVLRLYGAEPQGPPIGLVALSAVCRRFGTATLWYVLGDPRFAGQGHTSRAVSSLLTHAFDDLGLEAVLAWAVDQNGASIRVLEKNGFRCIGRQRRCHVIEGRRADRLLFDLLKDEHATRSIHARATAGRHR